MRAIQSISWTANWREHRIDRAELDRSGGAALKDLRHHLTLRGSHDDAISTPHGRARRDDDRVAIAIERLHGLAGHLERIDGLVEMPGKRDFIPAMAGRKTGIVEETTPTGLGEPQEGNRNRPVATRDHLWSAALAFDERSEFVECGTCRVDDLRDRLRRRPPRTSIMALTLGLVEGRRIEPRAPRKAGRRHLVPTGKGIDRGPDTVV